MKAESKAAVTKRGRGNGRAGTRLAAGDARPAPAAQRRRNGVGGVGASDQRVLQPPASNLLLQQLAPGKTLGQIARALDLNTEYVSRIFNRKRRPGLRTAIRISKFLNIDIAHLCDALGVMQAQTQTEAPTPQ